MIIDLKNLFVIKNKCINIKQTLIFNKCINYKDYIINISSYEKIEDITIFD